MSSVLSRRMVGTLLLAMAVATILGLLAWGPVGLSPRMHHYADSRTIWGVPNAMNVWTHLPLIPLGFWGLSRIVGLKGHDELRRVWSWFFVCQILATVGGMVYHWLPSDHLFVWDQMPKSAACSLLACAFLAERIDPRWGSTATAVAALGLSALGGIWWLVSPSWLGAGDLRPLMWLEYMPTLLVAAGAWSAPGKLLTREDWMRSLASFVVAQTVDWADAPIFKALGGLSGHSIRPLSLAVCVGWIAYRLGRAGGDKVSSPSDPGHARGMTRSARYAAIGYAGRDRA